MVRLGNWAISTAISSTMVQSRQAWTNSSSANVPSSPRNAITFRDARLQAVSSRHMYSEHGFEALIRPEAGQEGLARLPHRPAQRQVLGRVEPVLAGERLVVAGGHDGAGVPLQQARARDQRRHLLLLDHLPGDELLDVRVVDVADHHLGGAPGRPAGLDGAGGAVADLEEAHQA